MIAMYLTEKGGADGLVMGDIPEPRPAEGQVLVKIHATAVTPTELGWFPTFNLPTGQPRPFPVVLSHEFSGVIAALGPHVTGWNPGDAVFGLNDWFANGAQAEYCVASASGLAAKPSSLDHPQSAIVPISALTAWQGLFDRIGVQAGQRLLVHGASGAVGVFVVQLAHEHGVQVIATASAASADFVRSLGASQVIDYRNARFEDVVRDVDAVFDCVGGDTLRRSWNVLKPGGKLVTIVGEAAGPAEPRERDAFMLVVANGLQLREIAKRIDAGKLRVFVNEVLPLGMAAEAYSRARQGGLHGKIALGVIE